MQKYILLCLITLLTLLGQNSKLYAQTINDIPFYEERINKAKEKLSEYEEQLSIAESNRNKLIQEGHTEEERNLLTGENALEEIDKEILWIKENIDLCKSNLVSLERDLNSKMKESEQRMQEAAKAAAAAKERQKQAEEAAKKAKRQAEKASAEAQRQANEAAIEAQRQAEEAAKEAQRQAEEAAAEARRLEEARIQAQKIFEHIKMVVANSNAYTRNIGPRNGWDDKKTGTTIIRETNVRTNAIKPKAFKPVEEPSESEAQVYLATQEAILQRADKDISEFLRQHYEINDMYNSYGTFVLDKVCEYYQVNMLQLITKNIDDDLLKTIVNTAHQMNDIANRKLNQYIDEWNQRRNVPTWNDLSQNKNTHQLLSVLTVMTAHNDGNLPEPIGSDATYYYYRLGYGEKIARVTKESATVDVVSGGAWRISQSEQQFIKNGTQGNPLQFVADAFQAGIRSYRISENGTGEESYWEDGKFKTYYINRPEVEFLDSKGIIRISNKFADTEVIPWDITPEIDYSLSLTGNIKDFLVSANPNEKTLSFSQKMVFPESTYVQGEVETGPNGVTIKGEAGKLFGPLSAGAGAKVNYSKDEDGNLKQKYGLYGTASGEIAFASVQGNIGVEIEPGQHSQISQSALDAVPYLPSNLQQRIINDLFDDASKRIKVYEHYTKQVRDADGGKYTEYSYVSSSEKERIRRQQLNRIKSINIPDVSIRPSHIHLFEVSLIQTGNENAAIEEEFEHE